LIPNNLPRANCSEQIIVIKTGIKSKLILFISARLKNLYSNKYHGALKLQQIIIKALEILKLKKNILFESDCPLST
jgi:hypothetical protein